MKPAELFGLEPIEPPTEDELASTCEAVARIISSPFFRDPDEGGALEELTTLIAAIAPLDVATLKTTVECMVRMSLKAGVIMGLVIADGRARGLKAPQAESRVN
jgi:hypothetical protein